MANVLDVTRSRDHRRPSHFRPLRMVGIVLKRLAQEPMYHLGRLRRRDPRIWVFANTRGFRDSPRYLARHIAAEHPDLQPCWIARTESEAEEAAAAGVTAAIRGTPDARSLQRRAGAAFLCIGINDLEWIQLGGSHLVMLYHGTALKRVLLDAELHRLSGGTLRARLAQRMYRWSLRRTYATVDLFVAGGELAKTRFLSSFGCEPSAVQILGSPRFDVISAGMEPGGARDDLRQRLGIAPDERLVLWLPTWREGGDASWLPPLDADIVGAALDGTKVRLVVKGHAHSEQAVIDEWLPAHPAVQVLREDEIDVNLLLHGVDALVTDYSSAIYDYAVLDRPILFFAPDVDNYDQQGRGLYEPYEALTGGTFHRTWESLLGAIVESVTGESEGIATARHVRAMARNRDAPGSSERIVLAVRQAVGIA
jgi:CDP-glycerol glycerophosphotransferase